jgi:flagellar hook-associated protein 1 FlgK
MSNGRVQFDIFGDNSVAASIDVTIANNDTTSLVTQINSKKSDTGISATVSGTGAILLSKLDGNDISLKSFTIASGTISGRQIDKFGEKIQSSPITIASGEHVISGGQIELTSPDTFSLTYNGATQSSAASSFDDGFVKKSNNFDKNTTEYSFKASSFIDGNLLDETQSIAVASSSSYALTLSSDNANQSIAAVFKPRVVNEFSSEEISKSIVSEIRKNAPKSRFIGDDFTLSDGFPVSGSAIEFQLGEQKYVATLNTTLDYTVSGSSVTIGTKSYSLSDALERLVEDSSFHVSGPEKDRLSIGFEKNGSSFRLFASAKDGVLSGHALVAATSNSTTQKNAFHVSNTSGAELLTGEIDLTQADKADFGEIIIGSTTYSLSFATAGDAITSNPALPTGVTISQVSTGTNKVKMKITLLESITDKNIRLKATNNSATFGFVTASSQILLEENNFSLSNYNNQRVATTSSVTSLADEIVSISGLDGEDLILVSSGTRKPTVIGSVDAKSQELDSRDMTARVHKNNENLIEIFDTKSGDLLGSRELSNKNNFLFRGFDWIIDGDLAALDEFKVLTNNQKKDDGSNLERIIALSSFSDSTGKGGYSERYNSLVTSAGFKLRSSEQSLIDAKAANDLAKDQKSEFSGVDLDTEAARLLEQQQAYQALARVLSTAKEMMDTLLRSM